MGNQPANNHEDQGTNRQPEDELEQRAIGSRCVWAGWRRGWGRGGRDADEKLFFKAGIDIRPCLLHGRQELGPEPAGLAIIDHFVDQILEAVVWGKAAIDGAEAGVVPAEAAEVLAGEGGA
jgi:hypothetical protein